MEIKIWCNGTKESVDLRTWERDDKWWGNDRRINDERGKNRNCWLLGTLLANSESREWVYEKRCSLCYKVMSPLFVIGFGLGGLGFEIFHARDKNKNKASYAVKPRFFILRVPFLVGTLLLANLRQLLHEDLLTSPSTLEHTLSMLRNTCRKSN